MSKPAAEPQGAGRKDPKLPIGQREGEGTNEVQHEPDPSAEPVPDGEHRYVPRTGHIHGND
jgi:hypothetical protein